MDNIDKSFKAPDGSIIVVTAKVVDKFNTYRQLNPLQPESAGVLIGERRGEHFIIKDISEPGESDRRSRFRVVRQGSHHQKAIDIAFKKSAGTMQYLGEWHSHPQDHPSPSILDVNSWNKKLKQERAMLAIIVGRKSIWIAKISSSECTVLIEF